MHLRVANFLLVATVVVLVAGILTAAAETNGYLPRTAGAPRFVGLGGLMFLSLSTSCAARVFPYVIRGREAVGRVVEVRVGDDGNGSFPVVRYAVEGNEFEFESSISSGRTRVGDVIRILYLADKPSDGWIRHWSHLYLLPLLFAGAGCVVLGIWLT